MLNEDDEFVTPQRPIKGKSDFSKTKLSFLADTTAKKSHFHLFEEKKPRPKEKGLRKLS